MRLLRLCTLLLAFAGCGKSEHAGGSGVDIPNSITAKVEHGDGTPARGVQVRVVASSRWADLVALGKSVVLDSAVTDDKGQFIAAVPDGESVNIEVIADSEGVSISYDSALTSITLGALGSVKAHWTPGATIRILGTSFTQQADLGGHVAFENVPSLNSGFVGVEKNRKASILEPIQLKNGEALDAGMLVAKSGFLLLDDFEQGTVYTYLDPWLKGSLWFTISDDHEGGGSSITPSTAEGDGWLSALTDSNAAEGHSVRLHYQIIPTEGYATYAILGCVLGTGLNADAMDSLEFMVQSDAPYEIGVPGKGIHRLPATESAWEKVILRRADLDSANIQGTIGLLQFVFGSTSGETFQLDNIRIYGDPFSLIRSQIPIP